MDAGTWLLSDIYEREIKLAQGAYIFMALAQLLRAAEMQAT